ncbi:hypothetical protein Z517_01027 [Fonsecaea pedrosoi CBS 271.37]|uniref:Major facilitator superfamily (MFS) profile domain-containing protein n=1 Tax=Fonsecaea pedrosoi CBS 271.37 TaxID=1442368 RepID=A0A0D2H418_9EURO|nr:uncharacterized protein Z517_01027 [Fonsecaea pedrosoi CBS 271.37]KIW85635.1 hypothetical protein Z517_01027 [Fonsecaea pedrosoi CBS 271.37]
MGLLAAKDETTMHEERVSDATQDATVVDRNIHHPTGWWNWRIVLSMIIVGLSMGLYGYDNSFVSPLMSLPLMIEKYQGYGVAFTAHNLDVLVTVPLVGAAMGTFLATPAMKYFGRKKTFIGAYFLLCTPGSFLQLFSPNISSMTVGRFWNYLGISVLTTTAPLYLSELVPAHVRGRAVGFCVAGVGAVAIIATTIVWATERIDDERQYKIPLAVQAACPVAFGFLTFLCPESPLWYLQHGKLEEARRILMSIRNQKTDIVDAEISMYRITLEEEAEMRKQTRFWDILNRANLKRTLTAGALISASQVGGQILVGTYSTVILVQSGVGNPFQMTVVIACLQFLGTIVGPTLVDRAGRRPVALVGFSLLFLLNMAAGGLAAAGLTTNSQRLGLASVFIIFGFVNAVSFQSLAYVLPTEIATPTLREPTMTWAMFWSYVTAIITTFAIPQITAADAGNLGAKAAFIFAGCVLITTIWAYFYIPETRARTVVEVDEMYALKLPMRKWRHYQCQTVQLTAEIVEHKSAGADHSEAGAAV